MVEVVSYKCPKCKDRVFSRANHDFRGCSCGAIAVDAGFSGYGGRLIWSDGIDPSQFDRQVLKLPQTQQELYDDWNTGTNKYGIIKEDNDE